MQEALQILNKYWKHDSFRSLQKEIIESIHSGKDTLAILPTGGGKSICFQVPSLMKEGICLVISPLVALMKDQVQNLQSKNITRRGFQSRLSCWMRHGIFHCRNFAFRFAFNYLSLPKDHAH